MDNNGLIYGYWLSGPHKGLSISWRQLTDGLTGNDNYWLHFDYTHPDTRRWFEQQSQLEPVVLNALLDGETRPRTTLIKRGVLLTLRGVNLSPGSVPEDMVAIRVWVEGNAIITTRRRPLLSVQDIVTLIENNEGPESPGEFIVTLSGRLIERMQQTIENTEDELDDIEEKIGTTKPFELRNDIANLRRQAISLRRYIYPQREAMAQLQNEKITLFNVNDRIHLREMTEHLIRYVDDLDSVRERATVTQEELANQQSEQLNNRMYVLSIVTAVFLPLGFLTGLFGINVAGIPGSDYPSAFWLFLLFLTMLIAAQLMLFKHKQWF
jgi:zinc transporter